MNRKRFARVLSVVLSLLLIFQACPVLAETQAPSSLKPTVAAVKPLPNVVGEVVKLRDANAKHYRLEDGSFEAIQYKYPIHFKEGKDWAEIDNTLGQVANTETPAADRLDTPGGFENKANSVKIRFAENTQGSRLVSVRSGSTGLSWGVSPEIDAVPAATLESTETLAGEETLAVKEASTMNRSVTATVRTQAAGASEKTRLPQPKNLQSGCIYPDIFPGVDLAYTIISQNIKEQIILKAADSKNTFSFQYHLKGLSMRTAEDGGIDLVDSAGTVTYHIPKPFMIDAMGAASDAVTLDFSQNDEGWQITISADATWLSDPNRAYPVIIDPDLQTTSTSQTIHETFVASMTPNTNYTSMGMLLTGKESSAYGICRTFIKFDLPALPSSARVIGANLNLAQYRWSPTTFSNYQLNVKAVTGTLNTNTVTWNNQPTVASSINDYCLADGSASWRNWDVTDLVGNWYTSGVNNGLVVMSENEAASTIVWFYSSDNIGLPSGNYPSITFRYIDTKGLEGAFTTHTLGLGRAGTASIQDLTGNLVVSRDDIGIPGNRLPVSIRHIFDLARRDQDIGYGKGWRTNYDQKVNALTIGTTYYYQLVDEDGTDHYFKYNNTTSKWEDELESSRILTIDSGNPDAYYTITDKDGNKLEFVNWGVLRRIKDNKTTPNTILLDYANINGSAWLSQLTDAAGRVYRLNRDGVGRLTSIDYLGSDSTVDKTVLFAYAGDFLTKITDPDGLSTFYAYDESGSLSSAMDVDGSSAQLTYTGSTIKRTAKINQYAVSGEAGSELGFDYGINTTTVSDTASVFTRVAANSGVNIVDVQNPDGSGLVKAIRLNKDVAVPSIGSQPMALIPGATYTVSFDYWADAANTNFHVDFYPDDLPQQGYTAQTTKQHADWTVQSSSQNMLAASFRIFNDRYATNPANIYVANLKITKTGGGLPIDPGSAVNRSAVDIVSITMPQTSRTVKALKIPSSSSFSVAEAAQLTLKPSTDYRVSFDYWSDSGSVPFSADLFPDDLPEVAPTATTSVQRYSFTINSSSGNLKDAMLRFFKVGNANIGNVFIANIEVCETAKASNPVLIRDGVKERINVYHFSAAGTTVDIVDEEGRAVYYHYGSGAGDNKKLTLASKLQRPVVNLLLNGSAEASGYFTDTLWGVPNGGGISRDTNDKKLGLKSIKMTSDSATGTRRLSYQNISLEAKRTYTMSAWVKTSGVTATTGVGADLYIYKDSEVFQSQVVNGTSDWQRITCTFTPSMTAVYTVCVGLANAAGTAWFDGIQLEEGVSASRYNLVENAGFESGSGIAASLWGYSNTVNPDGVVSGGSESPKAYSISSTGTSYKNIYQNINIASVQGDAFVLSGFAKAAAAQISSGREFHLYLQFNYTDSTTESKSVAFNASTDDWQYVSDTFIAAKAANSVTVYAVYAHEANAALFDNIQLYKEEFGQSYAYDNNGNVTSTVDLAKQETTFQYGSNKQLEKLIQPDGSSYEYLYDSQNNLTSATSSEGVKYTFTYDQYGNPLTSKTEDTATPPVLGSINSEAEYSSNGNYQTSITDARGKKTQYGINETFGVQETVTDPNNNEISYVYNTSRDLLASVSASDGTLTITNGYIYARGQLTSITHNGFSYQFDMDGLKNQTVVKIGMQAIVTNTFEPGNGPLKQTTFGNGHTVDFTYNRDGQLVEKTHNLDSVNDRYRYFYDRDGNVYRTEQVGGTSYTNTYDLIGRLVRTDGSNGHSIQLSYDVKNRLSVLTNTLSGQSNRIGYIYGDKNVSGQKDGSIYGIKVNDVQKLSYAYDVLSRRYSRTLQSGGNTFATNYGFVQGVSADKTTTMVETVSNGSQAQIKYTYDAKGNIETISEGNVLKATFHYNKLNQLVREDSVYQNKTIQYVYDAGGNMTQRTVHGYTLYPNIPEPATETIGYTYGDTNWKDKLTAINGNAITYDAIGNPTGYLDGWNFTWQRGRNLATATKTGTSIAYSYNDSGIRTKKTVNSTDTNYYLNGDSVATETSGTDRLDYFYDEKGNLFGFRLNGNDYYYVRNGQNDITGILDSNLSEVVTYSYDSWGKLLDICDTSNYNVGLKNPYRYRGYRYDTETGLYYLNSRYYDPQVGRFINADNISVISSNYTALSEKNLFTYCDNNPIMRIDTNGKSWFAAMAVGLAIGVGFQYAGDVYKNYKEGRTGFSIFYPSSSATEYVAAGLSGALAAIPGGPIKTAVVGAVANVVGDAIRGDIDSFADAGVSAIKGAVANVGGYVVNELAAAAKANKILNMSRSARKSYLMDDFYQNSQAYSNTNLSTFRNDPINQVKNRFGVYRAGFYSAFSSTGFGRMLEIE